MTHVSIRLSFVSKPIDEARFDRLDRSQRLIVLDLEAVGEEDATLTIRWSTRRSTVFAMGRGELRGGRLAAGLWSDLFFIEVGACLGLDCSRANVAAVNAGIVRRLGRQTLPLLFDGGDRVSATEALRVGLVDGLVPEGEHHLEWARQWIGRRSVAALISGASLLRHRGGDVTERAEFARLFATGEPQRGLGRFLEKTPLDFSDDVILESD